MFYCPKEYSGLYWLSGETGLTNWYERGIICARMKRGPGLTLYELI